MEIGIPAIATPGAGHSGHHSLSLQPHLPWSRHLTDKGHSTTAFKLAPMGVLSFDPLIN